MSEQPPQKLDKWLQAAQQWDADIDIAELEKQADEAAGVQRNPNDTFFLGSTPEAEPEPQEVPLEVLSVKDRARLQGNLPRDADRFVHINGKKYPIVHLSVRDMESFRAFVKPLEELFTYYYEEERDFTRFAVEIRPLIAQLLKVEVVGAAAIALRMDEDAARRIGTALDLLYVVLEQWMHNIEVSAVREMFPYPPEDDEEETFSDEQLGIKGDPNEANPIAFVESLCEKYHWRYNDVMDMTIIQIYLIGVSSAWKQYRIKREMNYKDKMREKFGGNVKSRGPKRRGLDQVFYNGRWVSIKDMDKREYMTYVNKMINGSYEDAVAIRR